MNSTLLLTDIQRFSVYDGPGIRTTFFLKGCLLRCPWCSNPETQSYEPEVFFLADKCLINKGINCSFCNPNYIQNIRLKVLNNFSISNVSKIHCPTKALGVYGYELKVSDFIKIVKKDYDYFINSGGGITFSGGEPLLQNIIPFLKAGKSMGIHTAIESSLFVPIENLRKVMEFVDLFIVDVKILSYDECKKIIGGDLRVYLENIDLLSRQRKNIIVRFPMVKGYTFTEKNLQLLINFIKDFKLSRIEVFSVHNLGQTKYKALGKKHQIFDVINDNELEMLSKLVEKETNSQVKILKH